MLREPKSLHRWPCLLMFLMSPSPVSWVVWGGPAQDPLQSTHNYIFLSDARVQVVYGHLGAFQGAEDRLPQNRVAKVRAEPGKPPRARRHWAPLTLVSTMAPPSCAQYERAPTPFIWASPEQIRLSLTCTKGADKLPSPYLV